VRCNVERRRRAFDAFAYNLPLTARARMTYYQRHVFFCCNQRDPPEACCNNHGASDMQAYAKERIKELGLNGKGKVRINKAGCLDRCDEGPVIVVYPDAVWYTYVDRHDVDEIIDSHVVHGRVVDRLKI
jgi:(2Fe-2S) ferredoxin